MPPYVVSAEGLKQAAGEFDLASIRQLALVGEGVDSAGAAQIARLCPNLTELDLSRNAIDDGEGLASLSQLQKLRWVVISSMITVVPQASGTGGRGPAAKEGAGANTGDACMLLCAQAHQ
jgi:hypothetical protein|eukprot:COSAG01_NODE_2358_length_7838_cov_7.568807_10_plen_120_part_00